MNLPEILAEDESLVAFDKPSGLAVAPEGRDSAPGTLSAMARDAFGEVLQGVHRLDTEASGVVLFARTKVALDFLSGQFQSKTAVRVQHAVVALGADARLPREFSVELAVGPDDERPGLWRTFKKRGGRPAGTDFRVLEDFGRFAWVECRPRTGRTHQVRLHLAASGAPILGDTLYGDPADRLLLSDLKRGYKGVDDERPLISRLALHASALGFIHPGSRLETQVSAPLPKDLAIALRNLRRYAGPGRSGSRPTPGPRR